MMSGEEVMRTLTVLIVFFCLAGVVHLLRHIAGHHCHRSCTSACTSSSFDETE
jgi:hypothetical protein